MTVQPSVSFWDCGEFIAASYSLQVPHPPGAPFFLLIGRIFSMIPFAENIAFRVNMMSVLSSAFSILFLFLIIVKLVENYKGKEFKSLFDAGVTYVAAMVGALSFAFSDTFWFNAVEAEVYAASTFLFAFIMYILMVWNEKADQTDNEKYIFLIAYLVGLSTAVHLMSVLAIVTVVMVVMFRKYVTDEAHLKQTGYLFMIHAAIILLVAIFRWMGEKDNPFGGAFRTVPEFIAYYQNFDSQMKMYFVVISAVFMGAFWKKVFKPNSFYLPLIFGGIALFLTYPGVVKYIPALMHTIAKDNITVEIIVLLIITGAMAGFAYYTYKNRKETLHVIAMSIIFIFLGFTPYAMVMVRANMNPPMNENNPDNFTEFVKYINREQYGDFPTFKRRYTLESHQTMVYESYKTDLDFWWRYQMNHMMTRYLLWNYAGRESWVQDAGANVAPLNGLFNNTIGKLINVRFEGNTKDSLFALPLILGILGIIFHFRRDWKMASAYMILFIFMAYLTAYYQNQQQPQPRERDYFYVGGFFVFSIWIGLGVQGLAEFVRGKMKSENAARYGIIGVLALATIFVPVRMLQANYHTHDRSNNYIPWDYAYNLLQSCAPNAILFTNGDNDTFPLWYLQDVEGVRRDIRIANLSLLNTDWYIMQLKHQEPYGAKKVKINIPDEQIRRIQPVEWTERQDVIPVPASVYEMFNVTDSSLKTGQIAFTMKPVINNAYARVQDQLAREIVLNNLWDRPIYFAVTCDVDSRIGLDPYLQLEGMASRVVPFVASNRNDLAINEKVMREQILGADKEINKDGSYRGFLYRGLNDPSIFLDENHQRLVGNYRNAFLRLAYHYQDTRQNEKALDVLKVMETKIPRDIVKIPYQNLYGIASVYRNNGDSATYAKLMQEVVMDAETEWNKNRQDPRVDTTPPIVLMDAYEALGMFDKNVTLINALLVYYPQDPNLRERLRLNQEKLGIPSPGQTEKDTVSQPAN